MRKPVFKHDGGYSEIYLKAEIARYKRYLQMDRGNPDAYSHRRKVRELKKELRRITEPILDDQKDDEEYWL